MTPGPLRVKLDTNLEDTLRLVRTIADQLDEIQDELAVVMDTHINRMLVLRPDLQANDRSNFLAGIFSYLGDGYDFRFDFADASRQVCTEVIYRALDGKSGIQFELVERVGNPTLSADDIADMALTAEPSRFAFVLYAEEKPGSRDHRARILTGEDARRRVVTLMQTDGDPASRRDVDRPKGDAPVVIPGSAHSRGLLPRLRGVPTRPRSSAYRPPRLHSGPV